MFPCSECLAVSNIPQVFSAGQNSAGTLLYLMLVQIFQVQSRYLVSGSLLWEREKADWRVLKGETRKHGGFRCHPDRPGDVAQSIE